MNHRLKFSFNELLEKESKKELSPEELAFKEEQIETLMIF